MTDDSGKMIFWTLLAFGGMGLTYMIGRKSGQIQALQAAQLTQTTPPATASMVTTVTLAAGAMNQSVPTGSSIALTVPPGGSLASVTGQNGTSETFVAGTTTQTYIVPSADVLTIAWKDASQQAQTTTLTLTVT